jgi:nucleoside phosphorylase
MPVYVPGMDVLVAAATSRELASVVGARTLECGIGPVEAAIAAARALAERSPEALVLIGLAGGRGIEAGTIVLGSAALYCDLHADVHVPRRVEPDQGLLASARSALPEARVEPIGTSAAVGGTTGCDVEAMEGFAVLRAAELAGVPALELRAVGNEIDEPDRSRWEFDRGLEALAWAVPRLLAAL